MCEYVLYARDASFSSNCQFARKEREECVMFGAMILRYVIIFHYKRQANILEMWKKGDFRTGLK